MPTSNRYTGRPEGHYLGYWEVPNPESFAALTVTEQSHGAFAYDRVTGEYKVYNPGSNTWSVLSVAGAYSLQSSFNTGATIALGTTALAITQGDTGIASITRNAGTAYCLTITSDQNKALLRIVPSGGSSAHAIELANTGTGKDVYGTGGLWTVTKAGVAAFASGAVAGAASGTAAWTLTLGDAVVSDGRVTVTEVNGTAAIVTIDSTSGVIADDAGMLTITAGGNNASGSNMIRLAPTGTPVDGSIGLEFVGGSGKLMQAIYVDCDNVDSHCVEINGGGAKASGKAVLAVTNDGNLASGGNLLRFTVGGTPNSSAVAMYLDSQFDLTAFTIDSDSATNHAVSITGAGHIAQNKGMVNVANTGNPVAGSAMVRVAPSGTPVEGSAGFLFVGSGKLMQAAYFDSDNVASHCVHIHGGGAKASGQGVLGVTNDGNLASGGTLAIFTLGGTPSTNSIAMYVDAQKDCYGFWIDSDAATQSAFVITGNGALASGTAMFDLRNTANVAAGGSMILVTPSGTPEEASYGFKYVGASKLMQAIYVDCDNVDNHCVSINGGGAKASGKAVLAVTNDGNLASGGNLLRFTVGGTPNTGAVSLYLDSQKDCTAVTIDTDSATSSAFILTGEGVVASGKAMLDVRNTGNVAAGGSMILVTPSGTPVETSVGLKYVGGGGKLMQAVNIDCDSVANHCVTINGGGALASTKAVFNLANDGNILSGANVFRLTLGGTPSTNSVAMYVDAQKDAYAVYIDSDAATQSAVVITGQGVVASGMAMLDVRNTGNVAAGGNMVLITPSGTPVATSCGIKFAGGSKVMQAMNLDSDNVNEDCVLINGGGAKASGKGVLTVTNDGNLASGGNVFRISVGGTPNSGAIAFEMVSQKDCEAVKIDSDSATNHAVLITGSGVVANDKAMIYVTNDAAIAAGSALARFDIGANTAGATAYALELNSAYTNAGLILGVQSSTTATSAVNITQSLNHATNVAATIQAAFIQLTTARSAGDVGAFKGACTSVATDSGGNYASFLCGAHTDGGGSAVHYGFYAPASLNLDYGWYSSYDNLVIDDKNVIFGTGSDFRLGYDETTTDALVLKEGTVGFLAFKGSAVAGFTAAADTAGNAVYIAAQNGGTHASQNPNGGSIFITTGAAGGGTGTAGLFTVNTLALVVSDQAGTGGGIFRTISGQTLDIQGGAGVSSIQISSSGSASIRTALVVIDDIKLSFGSGADWALAYDETTSDSLILYEGTIGALAIKGSAVTGSTFAAAADVAGNSLYLQMQKGGAHASQNPNGGSLFITTGSAGTGGAGTAGLVTINTLALVVSNQPGTGAGIIRGISGQNLNIYGGGGAGGFTIATGGGITVNEDITMASGKNLLVGVNGTMIAATASKIAFFGKTPRLRLTSGSWGGFATLGKLISAFKSIGLIA